MYKLDIRGNIVSDTLGEMYDYYGMACAYPKQVRNFLARVPENAEITVTINSAGGDVFAGSEIYTLLKSYKGNVTVDVYGIAASAAATIAVAGDTVRMSPTSMLMIHNPSTQTQGDQNEHRKNAETLDKVTDAIANAYVSKTGKSIQDIKDLMSKTTYMTAQQAVEQSFADEVLFAEDTAISNCGHSDIISDDVLQRYKKLRKAELKNELEKIRNGGITL